ncbi:hypothetical protein DdX_04106 [Ditylenchus destructor]|uniref:Uncharacterized protein n=1 Tax=Ditylenchus destructor TaxID=166010 RepID=A0AAD4RBT6_9BILA|nr:hypothetical protein DdX_04106 [Ditylenchus destructor]
MGDCKCLPPPPVFDLPPPPDPSLIWHLISDEPLESFEKVRLRETCDLTAENVLLKFFNSISTGSFGDWPPEGNVVYLLLTLFFLLLFLGCSTGICVLRRRRRQMKNNQRSIPSPNSSSKFSTETMATSTMAANKCTGAKNVAVVSWPSPATYHDSNTAGSPPAYRCATVVSRRPLVPPSQHYSENYGDYEESGTPPTAVRMYGSQSICQLAYMASPIQQRCANTLNRNGPKCAVLRPYPLPNSISMCGRHFRSPINCVHPPPVNSVRSPAPSCSYNSPAYCTLNQPYEEIGSRTHQSRGLPTDQTIYDDSEATIFEDLSENLRIMDGQRKPPPDSRPPPPPPNGKMASLTTPNNCKNGASPAISSMCSVGLGSDSISGGDIDLISSSSSGSSAADAELERLAVSNQDQNVQFSPPSGSDVDRRTANVRSRTSSELAGRESGYGTAKSRHRIWNHHNQSNHSNNSPQRLAIYNNYCDIPDIQVPERSTGPHNTIHDGSYPKVNTSAKTGNPEDTVKINSYPAPPPPARLQSMTYV